MSELSTRVQKTIATLRSVRPTVLPSLLLCDFANLEKEVRLLEEAGVECLPDGHGLRRPLPGTCQPVAPRAAEAVCEAGP